MKRFCRSALRISIFSAPAAGIACCRNSNSFWPKLACSPSPGNFSRQSNEHYSDSLGSSHLALRFRFDRTDEDLTEIESSLRKGGANMKIQTDEPLVMNTAVWFVMLSPLTVLIVGLVGALLVG